MALSFALAARAPARRKGKPERLFIALWPDAAVRDRLAAAATTLAATGRRIPPANLHLTLAFLGATAPERRPLIVKAMRDARPVGFDLTLDRVGHFASSRVVWLGATAASPALEAMQRRLTTLLRDAGFKLEERAFRPHVTIARDAIKPPAIGPQDLLPIVWPVRQLVLVRSSPGRGGSHYEIEEAVTLQSKPPHCRVAGP